MGSSPDDWGRLKKQPSSTCSSKGAIEWMSQARDLISHEKRKLFREKIKIREVAEQINSLGVLLETRRNPGVQEGSSPRSIS